MRHINMSTVWRFTTEPFPAFRSSLVFGRNKQDRAFLPVKDIVPDEDGLLPEGQFKVIKTKAKGTIMIVPGTDTTDRILAFVSVSGGFRGGCRLLESPDGAILAHASAGNACESAVAVAALVRPGDQLVFDSFGRRTDQIIVFRHDGSDIVRTTYTRAEWTALHEATTEAETL